MTKIYNYLFVSVSFRVNTKYFSMFTIYSHLHTHTHTRKHTQTHTHTEANTHTHTHTRIFIYKHREKKSDRKGECVAER